MKDNDTKQKFIELRAGGLSYDKIADQLEVSKQTLLKWNNDFRDEIATAECISYSTLLEAYGMVKHARIETLAKQINRIHDEIASRDLADVPTTKLYDIQARLTTLLGKETEDIQALLGRDALETTCLDFSTSIYKNLNEF